MTLKVVPAERVSEATVRSVDQKLPPACESVILLSPWATVSAPTVSVAA